MGDAGVGLINLGAKGVNFIAGHRVVSDENRSLDWSRNKAVYEGETQHNVGKFLGGNGLITLFTAGAGAIGTGTRAAGSGTEAMQALRLALQAGGNSAAIPATASAGASATRATVVTVATLAARKGRSPRCRRQVDLPRAGEAHQATRPARGLFGTVVPTRQLNSPQMPPLPRQSSGIMVSPQC